MNGCRCLRIIKRFLMILNDKIMNETFFIDIQMYNVIFQICMELPSMCDLTLYLLPVKCA